MMRASMLSGGLPGPITGGFGGDFGGSMGGLLAMSMLGMNVGAAGGMGAMFGTSGQGGATREMAPRADVDRGTLTPAGADLDALTASGVAPTILAFLMVATPTHVMYEILNEPDHATYVYRGGEGSLRDLNRAMALLGFRVEGIYADADSAGSAYRTAVERLPYLQMLRDSFVGRAIHTDAWADQLRALTTG
jgi:hypothetical protein